MNSAVKRPSFNDTTGGEIPHIENIRDCRCGCVPPDMMSLFQMAELRAKYRQEMKLKASEAAQNEVATPTADADTK